MADRDIENDDELAPEVSGDGPGGRHGGSVSGTDDHELVGPGHPPKKHQFPKGKSGNPKGRPKGAKGLKTIFDKEVNERLSITVNGRKQSLSKLELTVKRLVEKAMKGEQRSIEKLLDMNITLFGHGDEDEGEADRLTPAEEAFVASLMRRGPSSDEEADHAADIDLATDADENDDAAEDED
jgi:hypothetical protein